MVLSRWSDNSVCRCAGRLFRPSAVPRHLMCWAVRAGAASAVTSVQLWPTLTSVWVLSNFTINWINNDPVILTNMIECSISMIILFYYLPLYFLQNISVGIDWLCVRILITFACLPQFLQDNVLQFFAKSFSSSPLNVTREIYTSLGRPFWKEWIHV